MPTPWHVRFLVGLGVSVVVWVLGGLGALARLDDLAYDSLQCLRSRFVLSEPRVLLVAVEPRTLSEEPELLTRLLRDLAASGCRLVAFTFEVPSKVREFFVEAERVGKVVLGRIPVEGAGAPGETFLPALSESSPFKRIPWGVVRLPPSEAGVYRAHVRTYHEDAVTYPSLEVAAATLLLGEEAEIGSDSYLMEFRGGPGSLPNITLEGALSGNLIPELVQDMCVLVGLAPGPLDPPLATPTCGAGEGMSLLEYQGHALSTLLSGSRPREASRFLMLLLVLVAGILTAAFVQITSARWVGCVVVLEIALSAGLVVLAYLVMLLWIPPGEILLCQTILFVLYMYRGAAMLTRALQHFISDSASQLRDRCWPLQTRSQEPPWGLVAQVIHQTLDVNKLIFLEALNEKKRLKEIHALHCSLDDVIERRRDYTRSPYVDAISVKGPIKVNGFLRSTSEEEEQFLAPLHFCDELLGFWAIGIERAKIAAIPRFDALLKDYTCKISELLYQVRKASEKEAMARKPGSRLALESSVFLYQQLRGGLDLLQHRLEGLDAVINSLDTGIVVYDIFGRVLQVNTSMATLLKGEGLAPFEMTALDLILALSDFEETKARRLLRRVIVEGGGVSFPVKLRSQQGSRSVAYMTPVLQHDGDEAGADQQVARQIIVCELIDTTSISMTYELKSRLSERLSLQLRRDLASIELASVLMGTRNLPLEQRGMMSRLVTQKVQQSVSHMAECRQFFSRDGEVDELERFPVDPKDALSQAIEGCRASASQRGITIAVDQPEYVSYVLASATKLPELLSLILGLVCQDAADNSQVTIQLTEGEASVGFDFQNAGFGIPDDVFQEYLFGEQVPASKEFQKLHAAVKWVGGWGGTIGTTSAVGVGLRFRVELARFI